MTVRAEEHDENEDEDEDEALMEAAQNCSTLKAAEQQWAQVYDTEVTNVFSCQIPCSRIECQEGNS